MTWLSENSEALSVLVSVGTLLVWIVYLQVFLRSYRRQRKAMILINLGGGPGLDAHCLVTNMGADPIYIYAVVATIDCAGELIACPVTEIDGAEEWQEPSELRLWTRQGPLQSGHVRDMGPIGTIIEHVRRRRDLPSPDPGASDIRSVDLQVAAVLASDDLLVAASRHYDLVETGSGPALRATTIGASQIRSYRKRMAMQAALQKEIGAAS